MENHYEQCIAKIEMFIQQGDFNKANEILAEELAMPYIPQEYLIVFEKLKRLIPNENNKGSKYYENLEDIESAIISTKENKIKAIMSLEHMNLRPHLNRIRKWFLDENIDNWIKQELLIILLEQGIEGSMEVKFNNEVIEIDMKELSHPFQNEHYLAQVKNLEEELENESPSFLKLCLQELNFQVGLMFPFKHETIKSNEIINRVNDYLAVEVKD